MRSIHLLLFFLPFFPISIADIEFTVPSTGSIIRDGEVVTAQWRDSGKGPRISELSEYDLFLCAGEDTADSYVSPGVDFSVYHHQLITRLATGGSRYSVEGCCLFQRQFSIF